MITHFNITLELSKIGALNKYQNKKLQQNKDIKKYKNAVENTQEFIDILSMLKRYKAKDTHEIKLVTQNNYPMSQRFNTFGIHCLRKHEEWKEAGFKAIFHCHALDKNFKILDKKVRVLNRNIHDDTKIFIEKSSPMHGNMRKLKGHVTPCPFKFI